MIMIIIDVLDSITFKYFPVNNCKEFHPDTKINSYPIYQLNVIQMRKIPLTIFVIVHNAVNS